MITKKTALVSILMTLTVALPNVALAGKESCFGLFRGSDAPKAASAPEVASKAVVEQVREPLPPDRDPLFGKERAQELARETDKLGDYSTVTVALSSLVHLKVIVDTKADWMVRAVEGFGKKPVAQLDQKTIKAFLEHISSQPDLTKILEPYLRMYRGDTRPLKRDGDTYYLEELIASGTRKDLAIALIGQSLLESFAKKDSRLVSVTRPGAKKSKFGLMIMNGNPDVFIPGECANKACGEGTVVSAAALKSNAAPASSGSKDKKQISLIDYRGNAHTVQVQSRSSIERTVKEEREIYANAGPNDLVPVEIYHMVAYLAGGTTMIRMGDDMFHFGAGGWEHHVGNEGVKGFLLSHPYQKWMFRSYRGMGIPPFNVGIKMMIPQSQIDEVKALIQAQMNLPEDQKQGFNFTQNNCVQVLLRITTQAGLNLGDPKGFYGFSSSLAFRNLFLNPKYKVQSLNLYPMPGFDLTEAQYRSEFPQFIYRAYSVKEDVRLVYLPGHAKDRYQEAVLLGAVALAGDAGIDAVVSSMQTSGVIEHAGDLDGRLDFAVHEGWVTREPLALTAHGLETLTERAGDYDLSVLAKP